MSESIRPQFTNPNYQPPFDINTDVLDEPMPELGHGFRRKGDPIPTGINFVDAAENLRQYIMKFKEANRQLAKERDEAIKAKMTDEMTSCYNRNFFEKYKTEHFNSIDDHNRIGIILGDINGVNLVNDDPEFGYAVGDKMIKDTAKFLISKSRKEDRVIRLGGDEFVIICHNDNNDENFEEGLRKKANAMSLESPVSTAFGVAIYDKDLDYSDGIKEENKGLENTKNRAGFEMHDNKNRMKPEK